MGMHSHVFPPYTITLHFSRSTYNMNSIHPVAFTGSVNLLFLFYVSTLISFDFCYPVSPPINILGKSNQSMLKFRLGLTET